MSTSIHRRFGPLMLFIWLMAFHLSGAAQSTEQYVAQLDSVLALDDDQLSKVRAICFKSADEIKMIDKELQSISRGDMDPLEKEKQINAATERKKLIRSTRDADVQLLLTPEQQKVYEEKVKPAKPPVLHFGMNHDKANCVICVK